MTMPRTLIKIGNGEDANCRGEGQMLGEIRRKEATIICTVKIGHFLVVLAYQLHILTLLNTIA